MSFSNFHPRCVICYQMRTRTQHYKMRSRNLSDGTNVRKEKICSLKPYSSPFSLICWPRAAPRWTWSHTTTSGSGRTRRRAEAAEEEGEEEARGRLRPRLNGRRPTLRSRPSRRGWPGRGRGWRGWPRSCEGGGGPAPGGRAGPRTRRGELATIQTSEHTHGVLEIRIG